MISKGDGHVHLLPVLVANKIAAGEVVERPASVVKELVENAIDAGSKSIHITITQGGRKLIAVQDDGCGMTREDALLSLERQATSKILDVDDIERIDTLGFRGEAIPSIASVSRFTMTTRRADSDEGTQIQVNAGTLAGTQTIGCPAGTLVEVRDLFCNVPARRKFLRAYATEEAHVKALFTSHALAHPAISFSLTIDGREVYRLAASSSAFDRVRELFGPDFLANLLPIPEQAPDEKGISIQGFLERPNLTAPMRHDQFIFINGRPATAPSIAYAIKEAYPTRIGDTRPALILFISLPASQVDVNVHPTKREVRFRDNTAVKNAIERAFAAALSVRPVLKQATPAPEPGPWEKPEPATNSEPVVEKVHVTERAPESIPTRPVTPIPLPEPLPVSFAIEPESTQSKPWKWFKYLAQTSTGYLLIETDSGVVTLNPIAARARIIYERLLAATQDETPPSQLLLLPETIHLAPMESARIASSLPDIRRMGFQIEAFGTDSYKIEAVPPLLGTDSVASLLSTIASDMAAGGTRKGGSWREELIAKSIAKTLSGGIGVLTEKDATTLVEDLCCCKMPYVCPRGKPIMIFTSSRELDRRFNRA